MAVFQNLSFLLELKYLSLKEKKKLKCAVTENGGSVCFLVNKQCSLVVTSDVSSLSSNRLRSIQKHQTPVVGLDYVYGCVERGVLLPVDQYKLDTSSPSSPPLPLVSPRRAALTQEEAKGPASKTSADWSKGQAQPNVANRRGNVPEKFRIFAETDSDLPSYPDDFHVAKYVIYQKTNSCCVLELQSAGTDKGQRYRVVRYRKHDAPAEAAVLRDQLVFLSSSEDALDVFETLRKSLADSGLKKTSSLPRWVQDLGSTPLQQLLLEEKLNTGSLSQEVGFLVELLWTEALGCLGNVLRVPISKLSLNDVSRAEGLLLQAQKKMKGGDMMEASSLLEEVFTLLPHQDLQPPPPTAKLLSQKLDLCQLIRDVLNVSEMTLSSPVLSTVGKYRALRCSMEAVPPGSSDFHTVSRLLQGSVQIQQIVRVSRGVELQTFRRDLGNIKPLLHSSSPNNFVGILSRGLLLPCVGVEHHGIERTDVGNLGSGIYFSNAVSTSLKYSKPSTTDGSRLLLVCDVALGRCRDVHKRDPTLTQAPEGHHSVHGVRSSRTNTSEFEDDEYVVYSPDQVRLRYVVRFCVDGDQLKEFSPTVDMSSTPSPPSSQQELRLEGEEVDLVKNPLQEVTAGLLDSAGQQLPLQAVHVRCKLMDLLSQVIIFQKYTNQSSAPIEAKYVFPLEDSAAVCGFEAFINGKHVVGQVKEKEKARKEYKQAIQQGHGAYLMDQDAPDVFTISVGNLPPGATVLIKVTFVSELVVKDGSILFSLPGSVAPWQQSAALNQTTQVAVEKVCITDAAGTKEFTLDVSVEMPNKIASLHCITHKVQMKRTDCKAVLSVLPGQVMGSDGFQLSVTLSEVHLPRMWVEKHPDMDSQACMLVFYPDFKLSSSSVADEVILLLDTSESMRGEALRSAQRIALQVVQKLNHNLRLNIVLFGTDHREAFFTTQPLNMVRQAAESFIRQFLPVGGSTELWRPLRALSLLPPSRGVRNLLLLSDGHIQNAAFTLQLLRDNNLHSRLFTCGLSPTANRHMLRALAQAGGGSYEFFDIKTKHTWSEKVASQVKRMSSPGCSSVSVKWQQFNPAANPPLQAPKQLHALFNDCHTLVYGFVPHCTQATLLGNLRGEELKTMVSTSELQKTRGTFLHKLAARALIRDYEDGSLETSEAEHEGKKAELKSFIIELSKEFSILSQFTSFVAIEKRDSEQAEDGVTDVPKLIAEEDVDFLPYISWSSDSRSSGVEALTQDTEDEVPLEETCLYMSHALTEYTEDTQDTEDDEIMDNLEDEDSEDVDEGTCGSPVTSRGTMLMKEMLVPPPAEELSCHSLQRAAYRSSDVHLPPPPPVYSSFLGFPPPPPPAAAVPLSSDVRPSPPKITIGQPASLSHMRLANRAQLHGVTGPSPAGAAFGPGPAGAAFGPSPAGAAFGPGPAGAAFGPGPAGTLFGSSSAGEAFGLSPAGAGFGSPAGAGLVKYVPMMDRPSPPDLTEQSFSHEPTSVRRMARASNLCFKAAVITSAADQAQGSSISFSASMPASTSGHAVPQAMMSCFSASEVRQQTSQADILREPETLKPSSASPPAETSETPLFLFKRKDSFLRTQSRCKISLTPDRVLKASSSAGDAPDSLDLLPVIRSPASPSSEAVTDLSAGIQQYKEMKNKVSFYKPAGVPPPLRGLPPQEGRMVPALRMKLFSGKRSYGDLKPKWTKIFQLQHSDGFWDLTSELGDLINLNVDVFANVFLKSKGICSLGVNVHANILRMVATLLVLQLMRMEKLEEGKLLHSLFRLEDSSPPRTGRLKQVKKAVDWVCWADRQYPCICSRLEFGLNWESSTRQLLGFERLPAFSPLRGLDLQKTVPLLVNC